MDADNIKSRKYLFFITFIVNICSFAVGITYGWPSPVLPKLNGSVDPDSNPLKNGFLTITEESWIASLLSLGATFGPFLFGPMADNIGRKKTLIISAVPLSFHFLASSFIDAAWQLYILRFIGGFAGSCVYSITPIYLGEIADTKVRGAVSSWMPLFVSSGIVFAFAAGAYLSIMWFCITCGLLPLLFIGFAIIWMPESPHYLISKNMKHLAEENLCVLRGVDKSDSQNKVISVEISEIEKSIQESKSKEISFKQLFTYSDAVKKGLIICCGLMFFQQFSGMTVTLSYMQSMFQDAEIDLEPHIAVIIMGLFQAGFGVLVSILTDKLGRKCLQLFSTIGITMAHTVMGTYFYLKQSGNPVDEIKWLPIFCLALYMACYALGLGPVSWVIVGELFPPEARSKSSAIAASTCLISAFFTSLIFPFIVETIGMGPSFWIFALCTAVGVIFVWKLLPETKGKSLLEIQNFLNNKGVKV